MASSSTKKKRGAEMGFDGIGEKATEKRIKSWMKNQPSGNWRKWTQMKIRHTYISRTWTMVGEVEESYVDKLICPWGMHIEFGKLMADKKCHNSFVTLPEDVITHFNLTKASFNKNDISVVSCKNEGDKGYGTFYVLYCAICVKNRLPELLEKHKDKLPPNSKMEDFMSHYDELVAADKSIIEFQDLCGCILPNNPDVKAAPNSRRYIKRPICHSDKYHFKPDNKKSSTSSSSKRPSSYGNEDVATFTKKSKNTIINVSGEMGIREAQTSTVNIVGSKTSAKLTVRGKVKLKQSLDIGQLMDPKLSIHDPPKDSVDVWAQNYSLSVVLAAVNKNISQAAAVHLYETAHTGVKGYHSAVLSHVEVDGKKIVPPPKVRLNEHNIKDFQGALLDGYKTLDSTPYSALRGPLSKYYSIFNDGIQKFTMELNGVMIRCLDENYKITNIPWALTKIPGGSMDSQKLCDQIITQIATINKPKETADREFLTQLRLHHEEEGTIHPLPPMFFKCCTLESVDFIQKKIQLVFENWPVAIVADGCKVNQKAGEMLTEEYGLLSPTTRCSAHAGSGTLKRISSSKTMSVPEVVTFVEGLRPILRNFKLSGKSTSLLNDALEIMEMKPVKLMVWCPTRMANLLDSCKRTVVLLIPLCDTLISCGIKKEEAEYFLSPPCISILHLMADLQGLFIGSFLRKLDTDEALLIEVFTQSEKMVEELQNFKTPLHDSFLAGLSEDQYGNILFTKINDSGKEHTITLQGSSKPTRNLRNAEPESKVEKIIEECNSVKEKIVHNLIDNVQDQNQKKTLVEFASALDLSRKCDKATRIEYIKQLYNMYGKEYVHDVLPHSKLEYSDYTVTMKYPPKLNCTESELISEFNSCWSVLGKTWLKFKDTNPQPTRMLRFWIHILEEYSIEYPNLADLVLILLSISPGTGPLERSFSTLAKICFKDRSSISVEVLEVLYLLSILNVSDDEQLFEKAREILQKK